MQLLSDDTWLLSTVPSAIWGIFSEFFRYEYIVVYSFHSTQSFAIDFFCSKRSKRLIFKTRTY